MSKCFNRVLRSCLSLWLIANLAAVSAEEPQTSQQITVRDDQASALEASAKSKLIIVTIDGLRWQEVFTGADLTLLNDSEINSNVDALREQFSAENPPQRALKLMPFFNQVLAQQGALIGNVTSKQSITLSNNYYFSYPGYIEIYTGKVDPAITSNAKVETNTPNILERLQNKYQYPNKIGFFGSWDVFPFIMRRGKHEVFINTGFEPLEPASLGINLGFEETYLQKLNKVFDNTPSPWETVRLDAFTHAYAMSYMRNVKPRVMAISYGDTDDFAHDGEYDQYLKAAYRTDRMIAEIWDYIQHDPYYRNQTHLLITTDHGRGSTKADWQHHASKQAILGYMKALDQFPDGIVGSNQVWIGAIGPKVKSAPKADFSNLKLTQFAPTALTLLEECELSSDLSKPIVDILENNPCD